MSSLLKDDFRVKVASNGEKALKIAQADPGPDLILLDIMMPGMDGYEVCAELQANPDTRDIPVIFLTALTKDNDEEKGLKLGAVDYITKPYNLALVKARVRNHLALRHARIEVVRQRDQAEVALEKLRQLEQQRDALVHMIVHDLRTPLTGLVCYLDLLSTEEGTPTDFQANLRLSQRAARTLCDMVAALLDVSRLETGEMPFHCEHSDVGQLATTTIQRLGGLTRGRQISVNLPAQPVMAYCDPSLTGRIIQNLLDNSLKFTPPDGCIRIEIVPEEQCARLSIADTGPGIPAEFREQVFQKFAQVEARKDRRRFSTGLGLPFCKLAVEAQGGSIQIESEPGRGTIFRVRLPLATRSAEEHRTAFGPTASIATALTGEIECWSPSEAQGLPRVSCERSKQLSG
jgi:two-component system sensor histidine kinase/response regulator